MTLLNGAPSQCGPDTCQSTAAFVGDEMNTPLVVPKRS